MKRSEAVKRLREFRGTKEEIIEEFYKLHASIEGNMKKFMFRNYFIKNYYDLD